MFTQNILHYLPIKEITNFENYMVFDTASITSCITLFENRSTNSNTMQTKAKVLKNSSLNLNQVLYNNGLFFDVLLSKDDNFALIPADIKKLDMKIKSNYPQLGSLMKVGKGMETAANKIYTLLGEITFPVEYIRKHLSGENIYRYVIGGKFEDILYVEDVEKFENLPEHIREHLRKNRDFLSNRAEIKRNKNRVWWKYTFSLHKEYYHCDKIWCSYRDSHNRFALDTTGNCIGFTNTVAIFDTNPQISIKYILALVNSKLLEYQHKNNAKQTGGGVYEYVPNTIERYPIPTIGLEEQKKFIDVIDQILELKAADVNADTSELEEMIDLMVYELYKLTPEEIALVEESVK